MPIYERTFENAAADYEQSRPEYPRALYEDIFRYKSIDKSSEVLEIGVGTGKATRPFLETGCRLTGLEPGENLAALAQKRLKTYPGFELRNERLQDFTGPEGSCDLIYAATAFHWVPAEYGYPRVRTLLKSGGAFARFAYHAGPDKSRPVLAEEIEKVYRAVMGGGKQPEYGEHEAQKLADTAAAYGFEDTAYHLYRFTKDFTADQYMALLHTYSDHMALAEADRIRLFDGIYNAIRRHGGRVTVFYIADLQLARKP